MISSDAGPNMGAPRDDTWQVLGQVTLSSKPDYEFLSVDQTVKTLRGLNLPVTCQERLQQSVTEAVRNAMQRGDRYDPKAPVLVRVLVSNIETLQMEQQSPGGWGFFMIERTAQASSDLTCCVIELFVYREGGGDEHQGS